MVLLTHSIRRPSRFRNLGGRRITEVCVGARTGPRLMITIVGCLVMCSTSWCAAAAGRRRPHGSRAGLDPGVPSWTTRARRGDRAGQASPGHWPLGRQHLDMRINFRPVLLGHMATPTPRPSPRHRCWPSADGVPQDHILHASWLAALPPPLCVTSGPPPGPPPPLPPPPHSFLSTNGPS